MSRLTWREPAADVCYQRQVRDQLAETEPVPDVALDLKAARVRPVSRAIAEQIILKYEWLGTMAQTRHHFGIFFEQYCGGVCCVGINCTGGPAHKPFGIGAPELGFLARGACVHWAPSGTNSKLISWTSRLLRLNAPEIKVLIAYADTDAGECGTVYQASNWIYIGQTSGGVQLVSPLGRIMDAKMPSDVARKHGRRLGARRADVVKLLKAEGWREQPCNPKYRYCRVLDTEDRQLVDRVAAMQRPYPKRVRSIEAMRPASSRGRAV